MFQQLYMLLTCNTIWIEHYWFNWQKLWDFLLWMPANDFIFETILNLMSEDITINDLAYEIMLNAREKILFMKYRLQVINLHLNTEWISNKMKKCEEDGNVTQGIVVVDFKKSWIHSINTKNNWTLQQMWNVLAWSFYLLLVCWYSFEKINKQRIDNESKVVSSKLYIGQLIDKGKQDQNFVILFFEAITLCKKQRDPHIN